MPPLHATRTQVDMNEPAPRFEIELLVKLSEGQASAAFRGMSVNMSETGMLVRSEEERPTGTTLGFEFAPFAGTAEIVWTRSDENGDGPESLLGMRFLSMGRDDRKSLERILKGPTSPSRA